MAKWKSAFLNSLVPEYDAEESFTFGAPATEAEFSTLEAAISAPVPDELRELLREFNGIRDEDGPYYFATTQMPTAADYYREWDWPTDLLMERSADILYVCQENGYANMWGVVVRPFGPFQPGQIVAFDHDLIMDAETPEELFASPYESLLELVEAQYKRTA
ncbi:SMI1/KNR4 family protein [Alienimonas chondri]|uniref:Knr4/Smi1-like domain-containing protein n=1 Tax=Alienimonas chondri TaxID=2681879 RepID=A0ABX1VDA1_9PLAN|nr:SMI1/KNR4 family protein [Alienimonas chondri]NNJ25490.1 hypothetical protein [Alienimonas chondri]